MGFHLQQKLKAWRRARQMRKAHAVRPDTVPGGMPPPPGGADPVFAAGLACAGQVTEAPER